MAYLQNKTKLLFILIYVFTIYLTYNIMELNKEQRVAVILENNLERLKIEYQTLLYHQNITSATVYQSTIEIKELITILSKVNQLTKTITKKDILEEQKSILRDKLPAELNKEEYIILKLSQADKLFRIESTN